MATQKTHPFLFDNISAEDMHTSEGRGQLLEFVTMLQRQYQQ